MTSDSAVITDREDRLEGSGRLPPGPFTVVILLANILAFVLLWWIETGDSFLRTQETSEAAIWNIYLCAYGAKVNASIDKGEIWRLVSPVYLHANLIHLGLNAYALYGVGSLLELLVGRGFFLAVYSVSAVTATLASYAFTDQISVGASGAIFGLGGALVAWGYWTRRGPVQEVSRAVLAAAVPFCVYNIAIGALIPNVDNYSHLGGFLGGFLTMSLIVWGIKQGINEARLSRVLALSSSVLLIWGPAKAIVGGPDSLRVQRGGLEAVALQNKVFSRNYMLWDQEYNRMIKIWRRFQSQGASPTLEADLAEQYQKTLEKRKEFMESIRQSLQWIENDLNKQTVTQLIKVLDSPRLDLEAPSKQTHGTAALVSWTNKEFERLNECGQTIKNWQRRAVALFDLKFK